METCGSLVLTGELKERLERLATTVTRPAGATLFRRGDSAEGVYIVRSGKVCLGLDCNSSLYPKRILETGAIAGLPGTVAGAPYSLTATVVEDSELGFVPRESVLSCLRDNPKLCFQVMEMLSGEILGTRSALKQADWPLRGKG